jgi:N-acetylglucosamine-6-phosphate deacetylase
MNYWLTNGRIFTGESLLEQHAIEIKAGKIGLVVPQKTLRPQTPTIDLQGAYVAPAFIDLQIYGGGGSLFNTEPTQATIQKTYEVIRRSGTLHFQLTVSSTPLELMLTAIETARQYQDAGGAGLLGLHLEGPYFNPAKRGAHLAACVRKPTVAELSLLIEKGQDVVTYLTFAPEEIPDDCWPLLLKSGWHLSAGHSNATYAQAMAGFERGIGLVTHLFNAMSPLQSREVGLVGATYDAQVRASIIVDGIHTDYAAVRISKKMMGERLFLITDAVTNDTRGDYKFSFAGDRFVDEDGTLSGSALTMIQAVANCVQQVGIPLDEALRMASTYPAAAIEQAHVLGKIKTNFQADLVVFDDDFQVKGIVEKGLWESFSN